MLKERLEEKYIPEPNTGCWLWIGAVDGKGYGQIRYGDRNRPAHCVSYELAGKTIPNGKELDHKCRIRCCVNPDHLRPLWHWENVQLAVRKKVPQRTHCSKGHEFTKENTDIIAVSGRKRCKKCLAEYRLAYRRKHNAQ